MSAYGVSKFLFEFNRDPSVRSGFKEDPDRCLASFPLSQDEAKALANFDFRTLYDQGIHPLLLTALANGSAIPILTYFESIRTGKPVPKELVGTAVRRGPPPGAGKPA